MEFDFEILIILLEDPLLSRDDMPHLFIVSVLLLDDRRDVIIDTLSTL